MSPRLTVGIPTYARAQQLEQRLRELRSQYDGSFEIVVADNGSPDETQCLVRGLQEEMPYLRYVRVETNEGVDNNILRIYAHAQTPYVWFCSDAYPILHGAVARVLEVVCTYEPTVAFLGVKAAVDAPELSRPTSVYRGLADLRDYLVLERAVLLSTLLLRKSERFDLSLLEPYRGTWFVQVTLALHLLHDRFVLVDAPGEYVVVRQVNYIIASREFMHYWIVNFLEATNVGHLGYQPKEFRRLIMRQWGSYTKTLLISKIGTFRINRKVSLATAMKSLRLLGPGALLFLSSNLLVGALPTPLVKLGYATKYVRDDGPRRGIARYRDMTRRASSQGRVSSY